MNGLKFIENKKIINILSSLKISYNKIHKLVEILFNFVRNLNSE